LVEGGGSILKRMKEEDIKKLNLETPVRETLRQGKERKKKSVAERRKQ